MSSLLFLLSPLSPFEKLPQCNPVKTQLFLSHNMGENTARPLQCVFSVTCSVASHVTVLSELTVLTAVWHFLLSSQSLYPLFQLLGTPCVARGVPDLSLSLPSSAESVSIPFGNLPCLLASSQVLSKAQQKCAFPTELCQIPSMLSLSLSMAGSETLCKLLCLSWFSFLVYKTNLLRILT